MKTKTEFQKTLYATFHKKFEEIEKKPFNETTDSLKKLKTLIYYFTKDDRLFSLDIIDKKYSEPSFEKGLLIIGGYGTGKSSMIKAIHLTLREYGYYFCITDTQELTLEYECIPSDGKLNFFDRLKKGEWVFDDLINERAANNYGKVDLLKEIIEFRYNHKKKTHITCNYNPKYPNNLEEGLRQFHEKYGGRVYDRLFDMFNIVEFNGKSMRR